MSLSAAQAARPVEYIDSIKPHVTSVLDFWWWGSSDARPFGKAEYLFIAIAPKPTLVRSGWTWQALIYGSNRTVWYLNWVQTNDWCLIECVCLSLLSLSPPTISSLSLSLTHTHTHSLSPSIYICVWVCVWVYLHNPALMCWIFRVFFLFRDRLSS